MSYELGFSAEAWKEWKKLGSSLRNQFSKKLDERLRNPRVPSAKLRDLSDCYKIKLHSAGYRLIYRVDDGVLTVIVIAVGRRDGSKVYKSAAKRMGT